MYRSSIPECESLAPVLQVQLRGLEPCQPQHLVRMSNVGSIHKDADEVLDRVSGREVDGYSFTCHLMEDRGHAVA